MGKRANTIGILEQKANGKKRWEEKKTKFQKAKERAYFVRSDLKKGTFKSRKDVAKALRIALPDSEKWFQRRWKEKGMLDVHDLFNRSFQGYIPDCFNGYYKYVIEVDGSIHLLEWQKEKDRQKDMFFSKKGFKVFRVVAFDDRSFEAAVSEVTKIKANHSHENGITPEELIELQKNILLGSKRSKKKRQRKTSIAVKPTHGVIIRKSMPQKKTSDPKVIRRRAQEPDSVIYVRTK